MTTRLLITAFALLLAGCEIPGMGPDPRIAQREADAKAIGSACRHGLRSIEDCYMLNEKAPKAAVFTGWKEMDEYMRENKLETIVPQLPPPEAPGTKKKKKATEAAAAEGEAKAEAGSKAEPDKKADKH